MFSLNLKVVVVVRFPGIGEGPEQNEMLVSTAAQPIPHDTPTDTSELIYTNSETPEPRGETAAFNDFARAHIYPLKNATCRMLMVSSLK